MAITQFGVSDSMAVKLWAKNVAEAERETSDVAKLEGTEDDAIIHVKSDTSKGPGDQVTFALRARLSGKGFTEGQKAEGNAESLTFYSDAVVINELGQTVGVRSKNTIDSQRIPFDLREQAKNGLVEWWKDRKSASVFNHACGYTLANTESATSGSVFTGFNTVVAPSSDRHIWAGSASADSGLTSADTFTVSLIDRAKEKAMIGNNIIRPAMIGGMPKYVMYLDPSQVTSLRTNAGSGGWLDITRAAMQGGEITKNAIYTGALGEWNGVILRQSQDVSQGINGSSAVTTVRRAVMMGAQALVCGYGKASGAGTKYRWSEEMFDHDRLLEIGAWTIWGCKKTRFNSADFGTLVVSTYASRA